MRLTNAELQRQLARIAPRPDVQRALAVLASRNVKQSSLNPIQSTAVEVLQLWKTRALISKHTGYRIPGVSGLIARLSTVAADAKIDQYNLESDTSAGSIFIDSATGDFLGDTLVEKREKSQEMLNLDAELFGPSKRSA